LLGASRFGLIPLPDEPKFHRNIPMKLFEVLAAGKPAVVSDLPPIRDLVEAADCCVFVPAGDKRGYASAIAAFSAGN
jgi:glycosyltransferase involved in cell wall biosynthesis